jgi:hypothetical protein
MRVLAMMVFSGNMGSGTLVNINLAEGMWKPLSPDSTGYAMRKFACGKQ